MDTILKTIHLGKRFSSRWAVRDLNLDVHAGDVFGFLGPNGAGKSTTIRMILSLVRPTTGDVLLFGKSLLSHRRECLARVGGLVEGADFYLYLSARKNLEIVASMRGGAPRSEIDRVLEIAGLRDRSDDRVKTYSHGMKQRLGIAQALLGAPECIVLDEPTTGLDPQGIKEVRELIRTLSSDQGMTIFLSSHLLSEIEQTATSMAIINAGVMVAQGSVRDLLAASSGSFRIEASPMDRARAILESDSKVISVLRVNDAFDVEAPVSEIPRLNAALVAAGIEVRSLIPRRSLEEYFLALTESAPPDTNHAGSRNAGKENR